MLSTNVLCLKKRKKKSYCVANTTTNYGTTQSDKEKRTNSSTLIMLHITEDTPPDMLAGAMDLTIHLPTGRTAKMSAERSTPMMDLLVHITTSYGLQLSDYVLHALETPPPTPTTTTTNIVSDKILPYKPNTPIGALDIQHIRVVPKSKTMKKLHQQQQQPEVQQPFESTFRLKVYLPRNQLYVTRVNRHIRLDEIMKKVCDEKNLDPAKYEFRHPGNLDEILDPKLTLSDYQITEIYLAKTASTLQDFSANDLMALRKEEVRKQMHNKTGGGVFNLIFRRGAKTNSGCGSPASRSISPTHSDDSRSITPTTTITTNNEESKPKPPQRKRRPAPKPPQPSAKSENNLTICHSRNSSDSSGYHEASVLSENNNNNNNASLPRRPNSTILEDVNQNLGLTRLHSKSTGNLVPCSRKKKPAPPPPPIAKPCVEEPTASTTTTTITTITTTTSPPVVANLPESNIETVTVSESKEESTILQDTPPVVEEQPKVKTEDKLTVVQEESVPETTVPPSDDLEMSDWQYQLPSPPKAFRDSSPQETFTHYESATNGLESVVSTTELMEKLNAIKNEEVRSNDLVREEVKENPKPLRNSTVEEESPMSKLSLENLEKRKSLVYNRELATSLKVDAPASPQKDKETFGSSLLKFERTYEDISTKSSPNPRKYETIERSTLPNFKITTYGHLAKKVDIFEDDTVRSNKESTHERKFNRNETLNRYNNRPQTLRYNGNKMYRSESFSTDVITSKRVSRSKSNVALNKYEDVQRKNDENLAKSNSLFDVSGLQSLEVIRSIQDQLNSPMHSNENLYNDTKYRAPAINMSTWSERKKITSNVTPVRTKLIINTTSNDMVSNNSVEIHNGHELKTEITGNIIRISEAKKEPRKPFGDLNGNSNEQPHSISEIDTSRLPIVRSVELKKNYRDEMMHEQKPGVYRINSIVHQPVVRGFRSEKPSWNFSTLPSKNSKNEANLKRSESNKILNDTDELNVKKQQVYLRPSPPPFPKNDLKISIKSNNNGVDTKEQLLQAIRDFGGIKGLKTVRA